MMDYISLEIITGKVERPTHCSGLNGNPPFLSGSNYRECNSETGCKHKSRGYSSTHHECGPPTILYCECLDNRDYEDDIKEGRHRIKHYFLPEDIKSSPGDGPRCAYCYEHCK